MGWKPETVQIYTYRLSLQKLYVISKLSDLFSIPPLSWFDMMVAAPHCWTVHLGQCSSFFSFWGQLWGLRISGICQLCALCMCVVFRSHPTWHIGRDTVRHLSISGLTRGNGHLFRTVHYYCPDNTKYLFRHVLNAEKILKNKRSTLRRIIKRAHLHFRVVKWGVRVHTTYNGSVKAGVRELTMPKTPLVKFSTKFNPTSLKVTLH